MRTLLLVTAVLLLAPACARKQIRPEEVEKGLLHLLVPRQSDHDRKAEIYWMEPEGVRKPWPAVFYLHGAQEADPSGGKRFHDWGVLQKARSLGFLAVAVSLPGYGESTGPRDFCGPDSQQAVHDVIRYLRRVGKASERRIALVGVSHGANVAGKVAEAVAGIAGVVLVSGYYDLGESYARWRLDRDSPESQALAEQFRQETVVSEAGPVELMLRERSVLPVPTIQSPTLVLQGARDPITNPAQASELVRQLRARGVEAQLVVYPEAGHRIPLEARERDIEPFLKKVLAD